MPNEQEAACQATLRVKKIPTIICHSIWNRTHYGSPTESIAEILYASEVSQVASANLLIAVMRSFSRGTIAAPFVLAVIFMVIYFYRYSADFTNYNFFSRPVTDVINNDNQSETVTELHTQEVLVPKCEANMSVADIKDFSSLPDALKNFLYYRHCRTFPLLLDLPDKCGRDNRYKEVFLLLVIKSSPLNYNRREVLRKTWAKERLHKGMWIRRIFILGTSGSGNEKKKLNRLLTEEQKDFNDILQWDFNDMFYNLTLKQMLFYGWMERNCPNARFLLNGDDDVFAHTDNMMEYLRNLPDNDGSKHLFTGYLFLDEKVVRWSGSKYFIPVQIQESNTYLPYCGGGGYLLSGYTAMVIYRMSQSIPIHPIDDAYMGMCLSKAGLSPSSHSGVKTLGINIPSEGPYNLEACYLRDLLLVHRFLPADMYLMWKEVHDPHLKCDP